MYTYIETLDESTKKITRRIDVSDYETFDKHKFTLYLSKIRNEEKEFVIMRETEDKKECFGVYAFQFTN